MKDFEKELFIDGPAGQIHAFSHLGKLDGQLFASNMLVIVCHPHPLHGGSMDNKVVTTLMRTYRDLGIEVVRFNFRGVGKSTGEFDQGKGELEDLLAVIQWVFSEVRDKNLLLAGFSFGSAIAAQATYLVPGIQHLCLVAPPIERYEYARSNQFPVPVCVIQGDKDERVNAPGVYAWINSISSEIKLIQYSEATHFFHGYLSSIKQNLTDELIRQFGSEGK